MQIRENTGILVDPLVAIATSGILMSFVMSFDNLRNSEVLVGASP